MKLILPNIGQVRAVLLPAIRSQRIWSEALLLSRVMYWHHWATPKTAGQQRRPIGRWIVKSRAEWAEDVTATCGGEFSEWQVKRATARLKAAGFIEVQRHRFVGGGVVNFMRLSDQAVEAFQLGQAGSLVGEKVGVVESFRPVGVEHSRPNQSRLAPHSGAPLAYHSKAIEKNHREEHREHSGGLAPAGTGDQERGTQEEPMADVRDIAGKLEQDQAKARDPAHLAALLDLFSSGPTLGALEGIWRCAWIQGGHPQPVRPWTRAVQGQARLLLAALPPGAGGARMVAAALGNWPSFCALVAENRGYGKTPRRPSVGMMLSNIDSLEEWSACRTRGRSFGSTLSQVAHEVTISGPGAELARGGDDE